MVCGSAALGFCSEERLERTVDCPKLQIISMHIVRSAGPVFTAFVGRRYN